MMPALSANTQAILLLTAPLNVGLSTENVKLLSPGEYKSLAIHLRNMQREPADLIQSEATDILHACQPVIDVGRLRSLLARGFQLSQALERWQSRAIWVVSRADSNYPRCLKIRLREDAPAVLYGCGDMHLLDTGGLAVVGSRNAGHELLDYTARIGELAACAGRTVISGGARGVDRAAMRGSLEAGGLVIGVLAEDLEKNVVNREERNWLRDGRLVLVSAYDPSAGFNVGHALQRNKLIYAFSQAALVVDSDLNKGGTWAGAIEQLEKLHYVPLYIRSTGQRSAGLEALRERGAEPWPNPQDTAEFENIFQIEALRGRGHAQQNFPMFSSENRPLDISTQGDIAKRPNLSSLERPTSLSHVFSSAKIDVDASDRKQRAPTKPLESAEHQETPYREVDTNSTDGTTGTPADALFATVREVIAQLANVPMKDTEVANALNVSTAQAKAWLQRLVDDGVLEKKKNPVAYVAKPTGLFH